MCGNDKKFESRVERQQYRQQRAQRQAESKASQSSQVLGAAAGDSTEDSNDDSMGIPDSSEPVSYQDPEKRHKRETTVAPCVPRDVLSSPAILEIADRFRMSACSVLWRKTIDKKYE